MLAKHQKLTGKDINYILKRGKRVYGKVCTFLVIPQYTNNAYDQRAFQIPVKLDKRASTRNMLKRVWFWHIAQLQSNSSTSSSPRKGYYKIFAAINKKNLSPLIELIATHNKTDILTSRKTLLEKDIHFLFTRLSWWPHKTIRKTTKTSSHRRPQRIPKIRKKAD